MFQSQYATMEITDSVALTGAHQVALVRNYSGKLQDATQELENDLVSTQSGTHELTAVLDKIAAGELLGRRQDTAANQLLKRHPRGVQGGQVLAFLSDGVYVDIPTAVKTGRGGSYSNPPDQVGVWRVDAMSGASIRILPKDIGGQLAAGSLWSVRSPDNGDVLVRTDLSTGLQTDWFTGTGQGMQFLGVDHLGLPIVWTFANGHLEVWHVVAPDNAEQVYAVDYGGEPPIYPPEITEGDLIADGQGVWFGAPDGLYLYSGASFRKVAATAGIPAGPCV